MGETEREIQTNPEGTRKEAETLDARRVYAAPEVTVLDFESVMQGTSGHNSDFNRLSRR